MKTNIRKIEMKSKEIEAKGIKFYREDGGVEVARATLYVLKNDLHDGPFGLMEDVFVEESLRGQGVGSELVGMVVAEAQRQKCYKLICTSRYSRGDVHKLYEKLGFVKHGEEFRMDFRGES